jgi:hypothetical protein
MRLDERDGESEDVRLAGIGHDEEGKAANGGGEVVAEPPGARCVDLEIEARQRRRRRGTQYQAVSKV